MFLDGSDPNTKKIEKGQKLPLQKVRNDSPKRCESKTQPEEISVALEESSYYVL